MQLMISQSCHLLHHWKHLQKSSIIYNFCSFYSNILHTLLMINLLLCLLQRWKLLQFHLLIWLQLCFQKLPLGLIQLMQQLYQMQLRLIRLWFLFKNWKHLQQLNLFKSATTLVPTTTSLTQTTHATILLNVTETQPTMVSLLTLETSTITVLLQLISTPVLQLQLP